MTQISSKVFAKNKLLQQIRLENNLLKCTCQVLWLKKFAQQISNLSGTCHSPNHLKNRQIGEIPDNQFSCNKSEINVYLEEFQTISGKEITLECKVKGENKPIIEWLHNNSPIDLISGHNFYHISNDGSKLTIKTNLSKVQGYYACFVKNIGGTANSPQKWINSSINLSNKLKQNQIIHSFGSHLTLNCSDFEHKFWTKNDNKIEETVYKNRLRIAENGSLIFKNVLPSDSAVYKCVDHFNQNFESYSLKVSGKQIFKFLYKINFIFILIAKNRQFLQKFLILLLRLNLEELLLSNV